MTLGCDRGLAYDLMGRQADAQAEYRAALTGPDGDEARRRLALSLAISGDRSGARRRLRRSSLRAIAAAGRARAFVLALAGDTKAAMVAINAAMPGSWPRSRRSCSGCRPYSRARRRLPSTLASSRTPAHARYAAASRSAGDRQCDHEPAYRTSTQLAPRQPAPQPVPQQRRNRHRASAGRLRGSGSATSGGQAGTGAAEDLAPARQRLRRGRAHRPVSADEVEEQRPVRRHPGLCRSEPGPCAPAGRAVPRSADADTFAEDLETVDVTAFKWSNSPADQIVPLGT